MRLPLVPLAALGALGILLAGCAGQVAGSAPTTTDSPTTDAATGDGHGAVAGAAEVAEPPLGLTTIDAAGAVRHLDLLDETVTDLGTIGAPTAMSTDGRYLFAQTASGVEIIDSGVWTWDHVDHFHYYRAEPRLLGTVPGEGAVPREGAASIATTNLSTTGGTGVFFAGSGEAVLLDTEALSKGEVTEQFRIETDPHAGLVVPVGSFALVTDAENGDAVSVSGYTADGEPTGLTEPCLDAAGTIATRVGAVIGCRDGALLASVHDDALTIERIPLPDGATAPAPVHFDNREGRPTVAGLAGPGHSEAARDAAHDADDDRDRTSGSDGIWMLDTRARSWTLLPAPSPLVTVTAVDDDADHVLALAADGRVLVLDGADGAVLSSTEPLVADSLAAGHAPVLIADQQRAYLSAPAEQRLYEIDFADDARIARTFDTPTPPVFTAETGR